MKFIFGMFLILLGFQLLVEGLFGFHLPIFRFLIPFLIIAWGISLLRQPDWFSSYCSFFSQVKIVNSERIFFLDQIKQNYFNSAFSHCSFNARNMAPNREVWIAAKKSCLTLICDSNVHTIVYLTLDKSSVHCSSQSYGNQMFENENTIHMGRTDQRPAAFFHIKSKESSITITEQ